MSVVREPPAPLLPYRIQLAASLAAVGLIEAGVFAVGAEGDTWLWAAVAGSWVGRSLAVRWWDFKHGARTASWLPAAAFSVLAILVGFIVAIASLDAGRRGFAVYCGLLIAWWGGDAVDWAWRRSRRSKGPDDGRGVPRSAA